MASSFDWISICGIFLLIAANAFFVASEYSIVKIRRSKLDEMALLGNKRAALTAKITERLDAYLGATQLGITLSSLALGWLSEPALAQLLDPAFAALFKENTVWADVVSFALAFALIALLHVVFGELVPKAVALQRTEVTALGVSRILFVFYKIFAPFVWLFNALSGAVLKMFGLSPAEPSDLMHSEEEIKLIASASMKGGIIDKTESEIIKNAVDFSDKVARDIMIPRQDMECLYMEIPFDENMDIVKETGYTRYPVCDQDKDNIVGMVHLRDLMMNEKARDIRSILRDILFVAENSSVSEILHMMKKRKIHMAVVVDEYGGTSGLLSMEDILEEIVGDIQDEHDENEEVYEKRLPDGTYEFSGMALLDDAIEFMGLPPIEDAQEDTVGGYVFALLARKPEINDVVETTSCTFEILNVDGFRVKKVKATPKFKTAEEFAEPEL